jgi:hypothetical protein
MASMTKANQETDMKQTNENAVQDQDVIELGVASVETKGGGIPGGETEGKLFMPGISDE